MVTLDKGQWTRVMSTKGNAPCIGTRSIVKIKFGPNFTDLPVSPKERQLQKSCISLGEEWSVSPCTLMSHISDASLNSIMWQIYFQSNLNLFSAGSSVQTLIQGRIIWYERYTVKSTVEILTGSTIIKNNCHYLQYMWFTPPWSP